MLQRLEKRIKISSQKWFWNVLSLDGIKEPLRMSWSSVQRAEANNVLIVLD